MSARLINRGERLTAIERLLFRSGKGLRAVEIAESCGVDRRTIYRDLETLQKLGIPVTAILDSNCDPDGIAHPIPGNDDAARALVLYCDLAARAIIDGLSQGQVDAGIDTGAAAVLPELTPAADAQSVEASA